MDVRTLRRDILRVLGHKIRVYVIIAIDGPAGSGKSTTAREVARRLGYLYLDTGAMYRAATLAFQRAGEHATEDVATRILADLQIDLRHSGGELLVLLNGDNVSSAIRTSAVTNAVSEVAALPSVREKLVDEQRRIARSYAEEGGGVVLDGRDIGTVVFPDADLKFFMVAEDRIRAKRRCDELRKRGEDVSLESVLSEIRKRDERDSSRSTAPLRKAEDALEIDTTNLSIQEQVDLVAKTVKERQNLSAV